jgi:HD-GYP domain-containing protein (c-di-GMP phosphodiesterase class II)
MSMPDSTVADDLLLRDLVGGLSTPGGDRRLSVGIVGSAVHAPQPPVHCLQSCLGGDAGAIEARGCAFLVRAARNECAPAPTGDVRCAQGFAVAAQATSIGGRPATVVTVEGALATGPAESRAVDLLGRVDGAARLVQRIGQMLEENAGFANEVLQNYEQLNLIFDLTQQIAHVTDVKEIEEVLMQRVARLLASESVCVIGKDGPCRTYSAKPEGERRGLPDLCRGPGELRRAVDLVRRTRHVRVAADGARQVIAAPLIRLDDEMEVVLADRAAAQGAFSAGDMMLIESVLAFGGQIISNTELHERMRRMLLEVTRALVAAIDKKDHYTSGHSERGGFMTRLTAKELGVPPAQQQTMEWAGLLHDVGKIGIPEELLCKPSRLSPEEWEIVKQHPRMGYEILQPIASLGEILDGVLYHHEYPDGSGYPEGLVGDQIPLVARIVHVVDTFDALTSTRSYRKAYPIEEAFEIIRAEMGTRIDAEVAEAFFRAFAAYRRDHPEDFAVRFFALAGKEGALAAT